jgi:hypothetical protein
MFSGGEKKPYYSINAVIDIAAGALNLKMSILSHGR